MKTFGPFLTIMLFGTPPDQPSGQRTRVGPLAAWGIARYLAVQQTLAATKKPWLSKTILLNSLVAALLLAEAKVSSLQGFLPDSKYQIVAFALPILNMLLRVYTSQGLSFRPAMPRGEADQ